MSVDDDDGDNDLSLTTISILVSLSAGIQMCKYYVRKAYISTVWRRVDI